MPLRLNRLPDGSARNTFCRNRSPTRIKVDNRLISAILATNDPFPEPQMTTATKSDTAGPATDHPRRDRLSAGLVAALLATPLAAQDIAPGVAAAAPGLVLELNEIAQADPDSCRLTVVAINHLPQALSRAAWQIAIFDDQGAVTALPVLDFGALLAGKTKVALFDIPGTDCSRIGRIVVNDVAECRGEDGSDRRDACLGGLATRNRSGIEFGL